MNLNNLNDKQKEAVSFVDGPCLVMAGAGSGKTKVLTTRIANLVESGIPSYNILAITFTNKAAREMKDRVSLLINDNSSFIGTFHSFGLRVIRENIDKFNFDRNLSILDSDDVLSVIKKIMKDLNIDTKQYAPSYIRNRISFIKNEMLSRAQVEAFFNTPPEKIALKVYERYEDYIHKNNSVDFDDLIYLPVQLFERDIEVLEHYQDKFKYILIDEYQDTNESQYKMTKLLSNKYKNIFVVGDADQSIYSFRSANYENILNFEKDFPNAKVILLEENYRSTQNILNVANSVIKHNKQRKEKNLWSSKEIGSKIKYMRGYDEKHEITMIIDEIKRLSESGYENSDIALLYRTNAQARIAEDVFLKSGLSYKVVGSYYFYSRKEIKDLISYLRLIMNHHDDISLKRIINYPKRGIGDTTIKKIEESATLENKSMYDMLSSPKEMDFKELIDFMTKESESLSLTELVDLVLDKTGIIKELESEHTLDADIRCENLMEFKSITSSFEERTGSVNLNDFLEEIALIGDMSDHKESSGNEITLMTLHSAKGLEFKVVFMIGMEDGILPHANSMNSEGELEEERRLCYVGITRAKERLYITNAKRRMLYGKESINPESRFISEIDKTLLDMPASNMLEPKRINKEEYYHKKDDLNSGDDFVPGDVVNHTIYGRGVVVSVDKSIVTIAFNKDIGVMKLMKNHKSLTKEE